MEQRTVFGTCFPRPSTFNCVDVLKAIPSPLQSHHRLTWLLCLASSSTGPLAGWRCLAVAMVTFGPAMESRPAQAQSYPSGTASSDGVAPLLTWHCVLRGCAISRDPLEGISSSCVSTCAIGPGRLWHALVYTFYCFSAPFYQTLIGSDWRHKLSESP